MTLTPTTATPASSLSFMSSLLRLSPLSPRAHQALSLAATFLRSRHVFVKATVCGCAEGSYYINIKRATYGSYILPVCHQAQSSLSLHPGTKFQVMRNASVYPSPKDPQWHMLLGYGRRACHRQVNISPSGPDVLLLGDVPCSTNCLLLVYLWLSPSFFLSVIFIQILLLSALSKKETTHIPGKGGNQSRKPRISRWSPSTSSLFGSFNGQNAASLSLSGRYLLSLLSMCSDIKKNRARSNSKEKVTSEGPCQSHSVLNKFLSCSGKTVLDQT